MLPARTAVRTQATELALDGPPRFGPSQLSMSQLGACIYEFGGYLYKTIIVDNHISFTF